jgi:hypothetical protein
MKSEEFIHLKRSQRKRPQDGTKTESCDKTREFFDTKQRENSGMEANEF